MDWDKLRIFHAVADAGSLTHAGDKLNLSQSAVSRQIRALEEALNTTLFHRHARGLILTEQGELLFDATAAMTKRLDTAAARIRDSEEEVFGELRVTTTTGFGTLWLAPRLPKLYEKYPDLKIDLMLEERVLDLPMREADVAIRMKEPSQADLIRKKLMMIKMCLYATPDYLAINGTPKRIEDIANHRLICQNTDSDQVGAGAASGATPHDLRYPLAPDRQQLLRRSAGRAQQPRNRCPARLRDRGFSRPRSGPARPRIQRMYPYSSPIRRNCGTRSGFPPSRTSCRTRSFPIANG